MRRLSGTVTGSTERRSARAAWARCGVRWTPPSRAASQSSSSRSPTRNSPGGSDARAGSPRNCTTPASPAVYDIGTHDGLHFLVMGYIEGRTVADLIAEEEGLTVGWSAAIATQTCAVLATAHRKCRIHRDLKPGNLMFCPDGVEKVFDFGLAGALEPNDLSRITSTGQQLGPLTYMTPEQIRTEPVSPQTDPYALGCVLHEMLSGEPPFTGIPYEITRGHIGRRPRPVRSSTGKSQRNWASSSPPCWPRSLRTGRPQPWRSTPGSHRSYATCVRRRMRCVRRRAIRCGCGRPSWPGSVSAPPSPVRPPIPARRPGAGRHARESPPSHPKRRRRSSSRSKPRLTRRRRPARSNCGTPATRPGRSCGTTVFTEAAETPGKAVQAAAAAEGEADPEVPSGRHQLAELLFEGADYASGRRRLGQGR